MQAIGVIGPIGKDLACVQTSDEFTGGRHIALLTGPQFEADRQAERIDYGVDFSFRNRFESDREPGLARAPFSSSASRLGLCTNDGGVDGKPFHVGVSRDRLEYSVEHALFDPAVITSFDGLVRAETVFRQVAPARTRAR